ncbi:TIGR04083 family peptide-modifying radical SAM enzyme [candidate division KSB1 bacterium]|nr:TIGR04083 family peptide-modifying radical SAM enzyme [candidate division KSB1 bacterium]
MYKLSSTNTKTPRQFMLIPSMACPANCEYCFGPNRGPVMSEEIFIAALDWMADTAATDKQIHLSFHGGEPLTAGVDWYRTALPALRDRFNGRLSMSIQSNLWLLNDKFCDLFKEHNVALGTSLDGPEEINDAQRGPGYYARNRRGIETARRNGFNIGAICTFTKHSAPRWREISDFFIQKNIPFSVHSAVSSLQNREMNNIVLSQEENAGLFISLFDYYLQNITRIKISTFDSMARSISCNRGGLCTFTNCLGNYLTIAPDGGIFSCNRFAHDAQWRLGFIQDKPSLEELSRTPVWIKLAEREEKVKQDCADCPHFSYCHGGCAYNAFTAGSDNRDPLCDVYKKIFEHITNRAIDQVFTDENMNKVLQGKNKNYGLLNKGPLLQIMRGGPHPSELADRAREIVAYVALAQTGTVEGAISRLSQHRLITNMESIRKRLQNRWLSLHHTSRRLVNAYIHVTYRCNLKCSHCYAGPNAFQNNTVFPIDHLLPFITVSAKAGFKKVVILGGEPLIIPHRKQFLEIMTRARELIKPSKLVLRTNLTSSIPVDELRLLGGCADRIVVSIDGDRKSHDARRGKGSYDAALNNLRRLLSLKPNSEITLAAVLTQSQMTGPEGDSVRRLGNELGLNVRFNPLLPLGRAASLSLQPEYDTSLFDDAESFAAIHKPFTTCGLGMNLLIGPDGDAFPCYTLMEEKNHLGNVFSDGLEEVLKRNDQYLNYTVDSNRGCRKCDLRYICGGFCRAWSQSDDPDAPPENCTALYNRAEKIFKNALHILNINENGIKLRYDGLKN